jgi:hypothetical protein
MLILMGLSIVSLITPISSSFASLEFDSEINLSNSPNPLFTDDVKIAKDGNIYVIWVEDKDTLFKRSLDNGETFETTQNLSNSADFTSNPQIAVSGNNVSVVWEEDSEIKIITSDTGGSSFGSVTNLSDNEATSVNPQIAMFDSNIFVVWQDNDDGDFDILFTKSTGHGNPFDAPTNLSLGQTLESGFPQISTDGQDVFVTWSDKTPQVFTGDIFLITSSSTATNFGTETNLSENSVNSKSPRIAVSGDNVHVIWDENGEISIRSSDDNGNSFKSQKNLSDNSGVSQTPQISASGDDVHVVWTDNTLGNNEILYVKGINTGSTYLPVINLSENDGSSTQPQIAVFENNVHVVWKDSSFGTNILLRSSGNGGSNFASFQQVSDNTNVSNEPQLVSSGNDVFFAWLDEGLGSGEVFFRTGSVSTNTITFDSSQYGIGENPIISVSDSGSINSIFNETKAVTITSDSSGEIQLDLTENEDTGIFTDSFTLTSGLSNSTSKNLHVEINDVITASIGDTTGSASILPVGINFNFNEYDFGDIAVITVL